MKNSEARVHTLLFTWAPPQPGASQRLAVPSMLLCLVLLTGFRLAGDVVKGQCPLPAKNWNLTDRSGLRLKS